MINKLIKLATHLDNKGHPIEADYLDALIKKHAKDYAGLNEVLDDFSGEFAAIINSWGSNHFPGKDAEVAKEHIFHVIEGFKNNPDGSYDKFKSALDSAIHRAAGGSEDQGTVRASGLRELISNDGAKVLSYGGGPEIKRVTTNLSPLMDNLKTLFKGLEELAEDD